MKNSRPSAPADIATPPAEPKAEAPTQAAMHAQIAGVALQFVNRAQLAGNEAEAAVSVKNWLAAIADGRIVLGPRA